MGFSRGFKEDKDTNQEAKLLGAPSMTSNQNPVLLQHHQQQQQQQQNHHHHQMNDPNHNQNNHHHHLQFPYGMMQASSSSSINNFLSKEASAYDLGDLDQALFLYLDGQEPSNVQEQRQMNTSHGMRPPTLNIFPSQPMHVEPSSSKVSTGLVSPIPSGSKRPSDPSIELANTRNDNASIPAPAPAPPSGSEPSKTIKREGNRKGPTSSSEQEGPKTPDPKTLRRLAQNREAARKSRLRKKAYVQQLESSRIKLTQLEQELQRARAQGMFFGGGGMIGDQQGINPVGINNLSPDAAVFDMEYSRWIEEHRRLMMELRAAVQEHLPDNELRIFVDNCLAHFDQVMHLKSMIAKSDVFHLVSGMWKSPAERCFMWMGGFRPSELIKVIPGHLEPLTEQQIMGICGLQQSTQEAEEALSQGLEALHNSISETLTSDSLSSPPNMANYMGQMALAINKLSTLEGFVRQADNLRHQTLHRLHQILTTRQAARCLLAIAEYFHRLRALSSLWVARPRQE